MPIDPALQEKFRTYKRRKLAIAEHAAAKEAAAAAEEAQRREAAADREDIARLSGVSKRMQEATFQVDGDLWQVTWVRKGVVTVELVKVQA